MNSNKINPFGLKRADTLRKYLHIAKQETGAAIELKTAPGKAYSAYSSLQVNVPPGYEQLLPLQKQFSPDCPFRPACTVLLAGTNRTITNAFNSKQLRIIVCYLHNQPILFSFQLFVARSLQCNHHQHKKLFEINTIKQLSVISHVSATAGNRNSQKNISTEVVAKITAAEFTHVEKILFW